MDGLNQFQLSWLSEYSAAAKPLNLLELGTPTLIFVAVATLVFGFIFIRRHLPSLAYFNAALSVVVISSFQACTSMAPGNIDRSPIGQATPNPNAKDLKKYFGDRTYVFSPREGSRGAGTHPDFEQYRVMLGIGDCRPTVASSSCRYLSEWREDDDANTLDDVWSVLKTCENGACFAASSTKRLVLDLRLNPSDLAEVPLITAEHGRPFPVLAYLIDLGGGQNTAPKVYILNPEFLSYQIRRTAFNEFSYLQNYEGLSGWFVGIFEDVDQETNEISSLSDQIYLSRMQGGINIASNETQLPAVKVAVWPESYFPMMPEYQISPVLTDNRQALLRDASYHGPVNVTGELYMQSEDLDFPTMYAPEPLSVRRTYRSFNGSMDAFGRAWSASFLMRRDYYALNTPTGPLGTFEFLRSGEGRQFFMANSQTGPGPFFPVDDSQTPQDEAAFTPDPVATRLLQTFDANGNPNDRQNIQFDLNGRLVSKQAPRSGNKLFHFYDGGIRLIADQLITHNSPAVFQRMISNFKNAEVKFHAGLYAEASAAARLNIGMDASGSSEGNLFGRMIYFFKNAKGLITGVIDQQGNMLVYTYDRDTLTRVDRIAYENPKNLSAPSLSAPTHIISYSYFEPDERGPTWSALVKKVSTPDRENLLEVEEWEESESLFGEAPVVKKLKLGVSDFEYKYRFKFQNLNDISTTEVVDDLGRKYKYQWDTRGYVIEARGPNETEEDALLLSRIYNPKNLRTINTIAKKIETFTSYGTDGLPLSTSICADRAQPGDAQAVEAQLATVDANGEPTNLLCDGGISRTSQFFARRFRTEDFYVDLAATITPTKVQLPSSLQNDVPRIYSTVLDCDSPTISQTTYGARVSGTRCEYTNFYPQMDWKGKYPVLHMAEDFSDGSFKASAVSSPNLTPTPQPGADFTVIDENLPGFGTNQFGNFTSNYSIGINSVYSPSGTKTLTAILNVFYDIYGNAVTRWGPWDVGMRNHETAKYYYDYRKPTARISGIHQSYRRPVDVPDSGFVLAASKVGLGLGSGPGGSADGIIHTNLFTVDGSGADALQAELRKAYVKQAGWILDNRFADDRMSPGLITSPNGERITRTFENGRIKEEEFKIRKKVSSNEVLANVKKFYFYDDQERLVKVTEPEGISTKTIYRNNFDHGVDFVEVDSTGAGGGKTKSKVLTRDWAGRPLTMSVETTLSDSAADNLTTVTLEYGVFGEEYRKTVASNPSNRTLVTEINREAQTGIVLSEIQYGTGATVDNRLFESQYEEFDRNLTPRKVIQLVNSVPVAEKETSGVIGKDETVTIRGKASAAVDGGVSTTYSRTRQQFDGCGNLVKQYDYPDADQTNLYAHVTNVQIEYGLGQCLISKITEPTGWFKEFGYFSDGSVAVISEFTNRREVPSQGGVKYFASYMECDKLSQGQGYFGRCAAPGMMYQFEARIDPGVTPQGEVGQLLRGATAKWSSPRGQVLQSKRFVDELEYIDENEVTALNITKGSELGKSYQTIQSLKEEETKQWLGTSIVNFTKTEMDPGLGITKKLAQNRISPVGEGRVVQGGLHILEADAAGQILSVKAYSAQSSSGSPEGFTVAPTLANLRSNLEVNSWQNGVATQSSNHINIGPGIYVDEVVTNELVGETTLIGRTESLRNYHSGPNSYQVSGVTSTLYDGNARPSAINYISTPAAGKNLMGFQSNRSTRLDLLGRMVNFSLKMNDLPGSSTTSEYEVGGAPIARTQIAGASGNLNLSVAYRTNGFIMNYAGITADYTILAGDDSNAGTIASIVITGPDGAGYTYRPFPVNPRIRVNGVEVEEPYPSNVEPLAGQVLGPRWFESETNLTAMRVNNREVPGFALQSGPVDPSFRSLEMEVRNGLAYTIHHFNPYSNNVLPTGRITRSRELRIADPTPDYQASCDALFPRGMDVKSHWEDPRVSQNVVFDERGSLNFNKRLFRGPENSTFIASVEHRFDSNSRLGRSTEILRLLKPNDTFFASRDSSGEPKIFRFLDKAYFYAPAPPANFPEKNLLLKMTVIDRNSKSFASNYEEIKDYSVQGSFEGQWVFVPGPMGPVMGFHSNGSGVLKSYDFIYDRNGNVIMMRQRSGPNVLAPQYREAYAPFLSSVTMRYANATPVVREAKIVRYEVSDTLDRLWDLSYHSGDPRQFPGPSLVGALGAPRDMLGVHYFGSTAYDTYTGSNITFSSDGVNEVCLGGVGLVRQAEGLQEKRTARAADIPERVSPSRIDRERAADKYLLADQNLVSAWAEYGLSPDGPLGGLQMLWISRQQGNQWYYREAIGTSHYGVYAIADIASYFVPVVGGVRGVEEAFAEGTPLHQGLAIGSLAFDFFPFTGAAKRFGIGYGFKYIGDVGSIGTDGAQMFFGMAEEEY